MKKYKVGDPVVHLSHGVGKVVDLHTREFGKDQVQSFYVLEIEDNGAPKKVFVPVEASEQRLRPIMDRVALQRVITILKEPSDEQIDHQTWNRRYREYMERIHTGQAAEIARVIVALRDLKHDKELSFGERKLLDQAEQLIRKEFEAAGVDGSEVGL